MLFFGVVASSWALVLAADADSDSCELLQTPKKKPSLPAKWDGFASLCYAPYALCSDAECEQPVDGYSKCKCNMEAESWSILPTNTSGAPLVEGIDVDMCDDMKSGEIYSTYGAGSSNPMPGTLWSVCPPQTSFAFCWGAKCEQVDSETAACQCPITSSLDPNVDQLLITSKGACAAFKKQDADPCDTSKFTFNSGEEWMFKLLVLDHPVFERHGACHRYK
eukprot:CAMPEP_0197630156 /NCGR_PEP_ID=MMETSP1338-20131121/7736_1 /TAXON_ID=43686 ORGANISM="Pelagodinium beii, Strain RCC1491" /NCGR_SAMPLE_ID=MMETSP1338 /ASSEMBLY_ACC=CAM_ASM_000754 /LENGTH=220 /DNA_ID=CAMNT_0043201315 /DNA_START=66 /DNA_END=728 /DNA_ORIENTATION=+